MFLLKSSLLLFSPWGGSNSNNAILSAPKQGLQNIFKPFVDRPSTGTSKSNDASQETIQSFINTLNNQGKGDQKSSSDIEKMVMTYFDDDVEYVDTSFYNPIMGKDDLLRHFLLFKESDSSSLTVQPNRKIVIDDIASGTKDDKDDVVNVCVQYHLEELLGESISENGNLVPDSIGMTFYSLRNGKITSVFDVIEPPSPKPGNDGLKLLEAASSVLGKNDGDEVNFDASATSNVVEKYFDAWNRRDMQTAVECFSDNCVYQDLQYDTPFSGKESMEKHLLNVAKCLPQSFRFNVDDIVTMPNKNTFASDYKEKVGVLWHVESNDDELPFTRGCSFYTTQRNGLIQSGIDIPEPAVIKKGAFSSVAKTFAKEPIRLLPASMWIAYIAIVFFSDGILPGANALVLEQRTWEEVRDLSLNFFLVSPILNLPFAPVVHPMLEGVFNLLLAWAAMFAGFLSDERRTKPNLLPFEPIVIGMQFLTSAFFLPYLAFRSSEDDEIKETIYKEDMGSVQATIGEWRPLGAFLGAVGTTSIGWAFLARPEFGDFAQRYASFLELLSVDRVGSSFLVDLVIFALFQGWFVDDDMKRRGVVVNEMVPLKNVAKFLPFFGLALYLSFRPELPSKDEAQVS